MSHRYCWILSLFGYLSRIRRLIYPLEVLISFSLVTGAIQRSRVDQTCNFKYVKLCEINSVLRLSRSNPESESELEFLGLCISFFSDTANLWIPPDLPLDPSPTQISWKCCELECSENESLQGKLMSRKLLLKISLLLLKRILGCLTQTATVDDYLMCHSKGISEVFALTLDLRNELMCRGWYFSNFNHIFFCHILQFPSDHCLFCRLCENRSLSCL